MAKKQEIYIAEQIGYFFSIPKKDADGKPIVKRNANTGVEIPKTTLCHFTATEYKASKGLLCKFKVDKDTPEDVAEAVRRIHKKNADVYTEKEYMKRMNLPQYQATEQLEAITEELESEKAINATANKALEDSKSEMSKMQAKLDKLEKKDK